MSGCIFCSIANGGTPANLLYEDDHVVAFADIAPQAPIHMLIVPKIHVRNLTDAVSPEVLGALCAAVPHVARTCGVEESGYRIIVNNGPDAGQTVDHLHVHLLGGTAFSHGMVSTGS